MFVDDSANLKIEPAGAVAGQMVTTSVWWSVRAQPKDMVVAQGSVFLRGTKAERGVAWAPVGAFTQNMVGLTKVRRGNGMVSFNPINEDITRVTLRIGYEPEGFIEQAGDKLGILSNRVQGDLERFKEFIEARGRETGAWRGKI